MVALTNEAVEMEAQKKAQDLLEGAKAKPIHDNYDLAERLKNKRDIGRDSQAIVREDNPKAALSLAGRLRLPKEIAQTVDKMTLQKMAYATLEYNKGVITNYIVSNLESIISDQVIPDKNILGIITNLAKVQPNPYEEPISLLIRTGAKEHDETCDLVEKTAELMKQLEKGGAMQIADEIIKNASEFVQMRYQFIRSQDVANMVVFTYYTELKNGYESRFTTEDGKKRKVDRSKVARFVRESIDFIRRIQSDYPENADAISTCTLNPLCADGIGMSIFGPLKQERDEVRDTEEQKKYDEEKRNIYD